MPSNGAGLLFRMSDKPRLLDQVRHAVRVRHYSYRTEQQYVAWIRRFIIFHGRRHPFELGGPEVEAFLSHLAADCDVSAATQAQALAALLFLYKAVMGIDLPWLGNIVRARRPKRIPVVLSRVEVRRVLALLPGVHGLLGALLYGAGLRLTEGLTLRVTHDCLHTCSGAARSAAGRYFFLRWLRDCFLGCTRWPVSDAASVTSPGIISCSGGPAFAAALAR